MRRMGSGLDIWEKMVLSAWISRVDHGKVKNASRVLTFVLYGMSCQGTPLVRWYEIWYTYDMLRFENIFDIFSGCFHVPRCLMMCEQMLKELLNKKNWQYINFFFKSNQQILYYMQFVIQYTMMWYILYIKSSQSQDEILLCLWQVQQNMLKIKTK